MHATQRKTWQFGFCFIQFSCNESGVSWRKYFRGFIVLTTVSSNFTTLTGRSLEVLTKSLCMTSSNSYMCALNRVFKRTLNGKFCWSFLDQGYFVATPAVAENITCATLTRKICFTWKSLFVVKGPPVASLSGVPAPTSSGCALPASSDGMPCWRLGLGTLIVLSVRSGKFLLK